MLDLRVLDVVTMLAPLGVRYWDEVTQSVVDRGLIVEAYPAGAPRLRVAGQVNLSGIYVFHHLSWLREIERRSGDAALWDSVLSPEMRPIYVVEIHDSERRYLSLQFKVPAPWPKVYTGSIDVMGQPTARPPGLPFLNSPTRSAPPGMGVLRAELFDHGLTQPGDPPGAPSGRPARRRSSKRRSSGRGGVSTEPVAWPTIGAVSRCPSRTRLR
ncbi:MAG: hypothetical protein IT305_13100 [Chloroflexi bacterium]|nr:hypothetical protein [Chloroflexota bacterium]